MGDADAALIARIEKRGDDESLHVVKIIMGLIEKNRLKGQEIEEMNASHYEVTGALTAQVEQQAKDIKKLQKEFEAAKVTFGEEKDKIRKDYDEQMDALNQKLALSNKSLGDWEAQTKELEDLKKKSEMTDIRLEQAKEIIDELQGKADEKVAEMRDQFLEQKARTQRDFEEKAKRIRAETTEQTIRKLDHTAQKIRNENRRMTEELKFQLMQTGELEEAKQSLHSESKRLQRELALRQETIVISAKKGQHQNSEVVGLSKRVMELEGSLNQLVEQFRKEREELVNQHQAQRKEQAWEIEGLKKLVELKSRELHKIRTLARKVLLQRSDAETFLIESIELMRAEMVKEAEMGIDLQHGGELPLNVDLRDMSWEQRERVLRLLFGKINAVARKSGNR